MSSRQLTYIYHGDDADPQSRDIAKTRYESLCAILMQDVMADDRDYVFDDNFAAATQGGRTAFYHVATLTLKEPLAAEVGECVHEQCFSGSDVAILAGREFKRDHKGWMRVR